LTLLPGEDELGGTEEVKARLFLPRGSGVLGGSAGRVDFGVFDASLLLSADFPEVDLRVVVGVDAELLLFAGFPKKDIRLFCFRFSEDFDLDAMVGQMKEH
jgi:hypothetical protein